MIISEEEKKRIQKLHQQSLKEFAGPEDYVVKIGVPAIDETHANQIIQECIYNGCPEKADQFSIFTSNLRF
jgi:hypothetical protein